jgi:hypothetical protein
MRSGAMIFITSLTKIGSGTQKLMGEKHRHHCDFSSQILFFLIRIVGWKLLYNSLTDTPIFVNLLRLFDVSVS